MDLNTNPSALDIYQIHRTPFFRRLHRNNSDQFERLKKAYDSIRSFDEKPIQLKVKQIRLGKLLQSIKNSLTKSKPNTKNQSQPKPKSKHQIRCEELAKARQKGSEYSRRNLNSISTPRLIQQNLTPQKEWLLRKSQLKRRIDYGNEKSEKNRSKINRIQAMYLQYSPDNGVFPPFPRPPTLAMKEKLRKLLVRYLSEDKANPDVVKSLEEIAKTRNHLYWDLMGAIRKQQRYIKRYGNFTKRLSKFAMESMEQNEPSIHVEIFESKTNIRPCGSEICIRTYRYSDEDEYLPTPTESLLRMPLQDNMMNVSDENPTRDELNKSREDSMEYNKSIQHFHLLQYIPEKNEDVPPQKFGEIIRNTVRKESEIMLTSLEKAMKH